jgi:hypothetical protein
MLARIKNSSIFVVSFTNQNYFLMFTVQKNQYIPFNAKKMPSGYPMCATYWYIVNSQGKKIDKKTFKPYRGKQMNRFTFKSESEAQQICEKINSEMLAQ